MLSSLELTIPRKRFPEENLSEEANPVPAAHPKLIAET